MPVRCQIQTGRFREQLENLKKRIKRYSGKSVKFKIGRTNNPENRWNGYLYAEPDEWDEMDEMVVLYRTSNRNSINNMERELIQFFLHDEPDPRCINDNTGGGPIGEPPYFLYIVRRLPGPTGRRASR